MIAAERERLSAGSREKVPYATLGIVCAVVALLPLVLQSPYLISIGVFIAIYALISLGLSLLMGYAGQVSMGQAAFYGIGAYASAILTARYGLNPWLAMGLGALLSAMTAGLLGMVVLRLEGHLLAVATLAFSIVAYTVFEQWTSVTGGTDGMPGIGGVAIAGVRLRGDVQYYYLIWAFLFILLLFSFHLIHSRVGRALRSIHPFAGGSEMAAESLGISPMKYKVQVFMLSAAYASLSGSLYAHWLGLVNPDTFGLVASIYPLIIVTIGGLGSLWGAVIGAAIFFVAAEGFRALIPILIPGSSGQYEILAWGVMIILVMRFLPRGLISIGDLVRAGRRERVWGR